MSEESEVVLGTAAKGDLEHPEAVEPEPEPEGWEDLLPTEGPTPGEDA